MEPTVSNERIMKTELKSRKPKNPLVAAARFRRAGSHGKTRHALRQGAKRALRMELARLSPGRGDDE